MEWPPRKERLKKDLIIMTGNMAICGTNAALLISENPKGFVKWAEAGVAIAAGLIGMNAAERLARDDYGAKPKQLSIYDELKVKER
jgi:hypothetical protein